MYRVRVAWGRGVGNIEMDILPSPGGHKSKRNPGRGGGGGGGVDWVRVREGHQFPRPMAEGRKWGRGNVETAVVRIGILREK